MQCLSFTVSQPLCRPGTSLTCDGSSVYQRTRPFGPQHPYIEYIRCYKLHILIEIDSIVYAYMTFLLYIYIYTHICIYIYTCNYHMRAWYIWILLYLTGMKSGYKREFRATASYKSVPGGERQDRPLPEIWKHRWHRRWSSAQDFSAGNPGGMDIFHQDSWIGVPNFTIW